MWNKKKLVGGDLWERMIFCFDLGLKKRGLNDVLTEILGARKNGKWREIVSLFIGETSGHMSKK